MLYDSLIGKILLWIVPYRVAEALFFSEYPDGATLRFKGHKPLHVEVVAVRGRKGFAHTWIVRTKKND